MTTRKTSGEQRVAERSWRTGAAFIAYIILIAGNVVAVAVTNRELPPFFGAGTRFVAATILFAIYAAARGLALPRGRALIGAVLFGALQFGLAFALTYWALQEVPPGLASVIFASVPLFTLFFAVALGQERLNWRGIVGALMALGGIGVIFGQRVSGDLPALYFAAIIGAAASFSLAPVIVKGFPEAPRATVNTVAMFTGMVLLLTLSRVAGEEPLIPRQAATWVAQLYLIGPGSLGVFSLMLYLLSRWSASAVSYQSVLSPLVAIALSAWLLDEPVTGGLLGGSLLVFVGVYIGALGRSSGGAEP